MKSEEYRPPTLTVTTTALTCTDLCTFIPMFLPFQ